MLNLLAAAPFLGMVVKLEELLPVLLTTVIFVAIGLIVFELRYRPWVPLITVQPPNILRNSSSQARRSRR